MESMSLAKITAELLIEIITDSFNKSKEIQRELDEVKHQNTYEGKIAKDIHELVLSLCV